MEERRIVVKTKAPLFIKLDRYDELIKTIHALKNNYVALVDVIDVIIGVADEIKNGLNIVENILKDLNSKLADLDAKFMKPSAMEHAEKEEKIENIDEIERYIREVSIRIEEIRKNLRKVYRIDKVKKEVKQ